MRHLLAMLALLLSALAAGAQITAGPDDVRLTLKVEERAHAPFDGEMVLITIHGAYRLPITLEKLRQPDLAGFDWMQLGEDHWYNTQEDGLTVTNLERRMALFPQAPGPIEIGAFTHQLTLLSPSGKRFEHEAVSNTLTVEVVPRPDSDWWFPARLIEVTDNWSNPPERLAPGGGALRIVTLTAQGVEPELLPPMPEMTSAGAFVFPHPEKRIVTLGPNGPITRAFWRWTVRPKGETAGYLNPVTIAYFDAEAREAREITLTAQRVAYAGAEDPPAGSDGGDSPTGAEPSAKAAGASAADGDAGFRLLRWAAPAGLLAGLALGLRSLGAAVRLPAWPALRSRWQRMFRRTPERALREAVAAGDALSAYRHARILIDRNDAPAPPEFKALERALFGEGDPTTSADLEALAKALRRGSWASGPPPGTGRPCPSEDGPAGDPR
ncbi:MAG: hypothetical protein AAF415_18260 [Pseudomonadota bacterium]